MATEEHKSEVGRPSKLAESIEPARKYLLGGFAELGDVVPSVAGLACYLAVSRSSIYEWSKVPGEFSDIVEGILSLQENKLLNGGLKGELNPTIAKLLLAKHGYADKAEVDNKSSDGTMTPQPTIIQLVPVEASNEPDSSTADTRETRTTLHDTE